MANPTLYKKVSTTEAQNRALVTPTTDENTKMASTLSTFITLFKAKHS